MVVNFEHMSRWSLTKLRETRASLRNSLAEEIHKRDAIKAEILYLQEEIGKYKRDL